MFNLAACASGLAWGLLTLVFWPSRLGASWIGWLLAAPLIGLLIGRLFIPAYRLSAKGQFGVSLATLYLAAALFGLAIGGADALRPGTHRIVSAVVLQGVAAALWGVTFTGLFVLLWPLAYLNHRWLGSMVEEAVAAPAEEPVPPADLPADPGTAASAILVQQDGENLTVVYPWFGPPAYFALIRAALTLPPILWPLPWQLSGELAMPFFWWPLWIALFALSAYSFVVLLRNRTVLGLGPHGLVLAHGPMRWTWDDRALGLSALLGGRFDMEVIYRRWWSRQDLRMIDFILADGERVHLMPWIGPRAETQRLCDALEAHRKKLQGRER